MKKLHKQIKELTKVVKALIELALEIGTLIAVIEFITK